MISFKSTSRVCMWIACSVGFGLFCQKPNFENTFLTVLYQYYELLHLWMKQNIVGKSFLHNISQYSAHLKQPVMFQRRYLPMMKFQLRPVTTIQSNVTKQWQQVWWFSSENMFHNNKLLISTWCVCGLVNYLCYWNNLVI